MRLKNKFFFDFLNKKVNIFHSKFFILHINQISNFLDIKNFCIENKLFLFKIKNSLYKRIFGYLNPISFLLKSSTFFIFIEDIEKKIILLKNLKNFVIKTNNFFVLGFYEKFKIYSMKNVFFYLNFYEKIKKSFDFFNILLLKVYIYLFFRVLTFSKIFIFKILKKDANLKSITKGS
jgi:hypothetical protein